MGHLVNPIAYRLGHTRSWEDNWYVKNIYYPEFLHSILKIRHYLHFFWTTRNMEKKGFILSHFYIFKYIKTLLVKIFLYNIDLEKDIYSFFARGNSLFLDAFKLRLKIKKKRKEPFFFERYKPDLFFLFFLYNSFFLKKKNKLYKKNKKNKFLNDYRKKKLKYTNITYLNNIRKGLLSAFIKKYKSEEVNNNFLRIEKYDEKIRNINLKKINMGFFDFLIYSFFKVNMLSKPVETKSRIKKRNYEQILNYPVKIEKWIKLLKKYIITKIKFNTKKKKSIKNFIFFLTFIINYIKITKKKSDRIRFKFKDLNLNLIRLIFFNKVLNNFSSFYGVFLRFIIYILTNINKSILKFCFITNNSVNAKFLARYIGLKLKKKFPLFTVINPVKKELRKLYKKKKNKKINLLIDLFDIKLKKNKTILDSKYGFKNVVLYFFDKYVEFYASYYYSFKTLITFDFLVFFFFAKKKFKNFQFFKKLKKKFIFFKKENRWKNKNFFLKKKWILFLFLFFKKKINFSIKFLSFINTYVRNKLLLTLFFTQNKYSLDNLVNIFFLLKFDINSFFFRNKNFLYFFMYNIFFNYNNLNLNTLFFLEFKYNILSNYFFKSFMYYIYVNYSFNTFVDDFKINKKKLFKKTKDIYRPSSFILGFKMSFKGRFTRKQRASSIWFHQGIVPLNTIKGIVDYAFFTIPLKNSAISIKLWIYKKSDKMIWHNKFLNKK